MVESVQIRIDRLGKLVTVVYSSCFGFVFPALACPCLQVYLASLPDFFENFTLPFDIDHDAKLYVSFAAVFAFALCVFVDVHERISDHADKIANNAAVNQRAAYLGCPRPRRVESADLAFQVSLVEP